ncbi:hypothetical protein B0H14DRAFT_3141806, partial [Mycena olivaceomarginata]
MAAGGEKNVASFAWILKAVPALLPPLAAHHGQLGRLVSVSSLVRGNVGSICCVGNNTGIQAKIGDATIGNQYAMKEFEFGLTSKIDAARWKRVLEATFGQSGREDASPGRNQPNHQANWRKYPVDPFFLHPHRIPDAVLRVASASYWLLRQYRRRRITLTATCSLTSVHAAWLDRMDIFFGPRSQDWVIPRAMIKAKPGLYVLAVFSNPTGEWISSYFFSFGPDIHVFRTPRSVAGAGLDISCGYAIRGAQGPRPRRRCFPFFIPRRLKRWLLVAPTSSLHLLCSITTYTHTIGFSFLWKTTDTTSSIREDLAYNTPPSFMPPARSQLCPLGGVSGFRLVYPILAIRSAICDGTGYSSFDSQSWNKPESDSLFFCVRSTLIFLTSVTGPGLESPRSHPGITCQHLRHHTTGLFDWKAREDPSGGAGTLEFCVPYKHRVQVMCGLQANISCSFLLPFVVWHEPEIITRSIIATISPPFFDGPESHPQMDKIYTAIPFFVSNRNPG